MSEPFQPEIKEKPLIVPGTIAHPPDPEHTSSESPPSEIDWDGKLGMKCQWGRDIKEIQDTVRQGKEQGWKFDWNSGLKRACEGGKKEMVQYMLTMGANNIQEAMDEAVLRMSFHLEALGDCRAIVKLVSSKL